jgi:hypothetical protein
MIFNGLHGFISQKIILFIVWIFVSKISKEPAFSFFMVEDNAESGEGGRGKSGEGDLGNSFLKSRTNWETGKS